MSVEEEKAKSVVSELVMRVDDSQIKELRAVLIGIEQTLEAIETRLARISRINEAA